MPTVIDELIVTLGIDASKFKTQADQTNALLVAVGRNAVQQSKALEEVLKKTQDSTQKRMKQGAEVGRQTAQQFSSFRKEAAALLATLATGFGIKQFVSGLVDADLSAGRLAGRLGISIRELGAWQEASKRSGGSAAATGAAMEAMSRDFQNWKITGQSAMLPWLLNLHVEWQKADGTMRDIGDIYKDINKRFSTMTPASANSIGAQFSMDAGLVALLQKKPTDLSVTLEQMEKLGVLTEAQFNAEVAFNTAILNIGQSFTDLGRDIVGDFLPQIDELIKRFRKWYDDGGRELIKKDIHEIAVAIENTVKLLGGWSNAASDLAIFIGGAWLTLMMAGLGPVSAMIATIAAGFIALKTATKFFDPNEWSPNSIFWPLLSKEEQLKYHDSPESRISRGEPEIDPNSRSLMHPSTWFRGNWAPIASVNMNPTQRGLLDTIAGPESGGQYNIKNGWSAQNDNSATRFSDFSKFPDGIAPGGTSTASGRYQITKGTWDELQRKYPGMLPDFSPKSQDTAAWLLARDRYATGSGGADLEADLKAGKNAKITTILNPTWPTLPGGSQNPQSQQIFDEAIKRNTNPNYKLEDNIVDPLKQFFHKNFGPDPALQKWSSPASLQTPPTSGSASGNSTTDVSVNTINIHTQATDASGIASVIADRLHRAVSVNQSDRGLA